MEPSYQGTFTGARRYVLETFANTKSALMKKRVSQYIIGRDCPTCDGKRLKREALSVKFAGLDIAEFGDLTVLKLKDLLMPVAHGEYGAVSTLKGPCSGKGGPRCSGRKTGCGGRLGAQGCARRAPHAQSLGREADRRTAPCLRIDRAAGPADRSWPWLHFARPQHADALLRRAAALAACHAIVVTAFRRGLCARRAFGGVAPGRWRSLAHHPRASQGGGQLPVRRRT